MIPKEGDLPPASAINEWTSLTEGLHARMHHLLGEAQREWQLSQKVDGWNQQRHEFDTDPPTQRGDALYCFAWMLEEGLCVRSDLKRTGAIYLALAAKDHPEAIASLAWCYLEGACGLAVDKGEAKRLYQRAKRLVSFRPPPTISHRHHRRQSRQDCQPLMSHALTDAHSPPLPLSLNRATPAQSTCCR